MSRKPTYVRLIQALLPFLLAATVVAQSACTTLARPASEPKLAPIVNENAKNRIPGQYIVVFKPGSSREVVRAAQNTVRKFEGTVRHTYTAALIGFSAQLPPEALKALRAIPELAYIEADQTGSIQTIQGNPPTGLDRIDRRHLPLNDTYTYSETGANVNVYVIDTGIRTTLSEFGGRAVASGNTADTDDCNGHGTHVAGTIGGTTYGVAKNVTLYAVRVTATGNCTEAMAASDVAAGVIWVINHAIRPAVANMSLQYLPASPSVDTAVTDSIAGMSGAGVPVTYVVAAGNFNGDACLFSPAGVSTAITVGASALSNDQPPKDTRWSSSNFGSCVDLFAPGVQILSAMPDGVAPLSGCTLASNTAGSRSQRCDGTSMAVPHVTGVAARYLENHPMATPAQVWQAIHNANNVSTTVGWAGVLEAGTNSPSNPNELLHWGSLNDGFNDGEPHLTTVDGVPYDFQSVGEFVSVRDGNGLEIQTRQTPIATTYNPGPNPYTGLATCVSLNTAVAARVGAHRVTYQPNISGVPDPRGLQLRVDGVLTTLGPNGLDLGDGGRVVKSPLGDGIEIDFPDETVLFVTPGWWASQSKWYLNVDVYHTRAAEGIMGAIAPDGWLPALPDGTSLGPMPAAMHQRYVDLYQTFADAWRVTDKTSLFDYAAGTSTATFTLRSWPPEYPPCVLPETRPVTPASLLTAQTACRLIADKNMNRNCVFDVRVTGEPGFAETYLLSERIRFGSTTTTVHSEDATQVGEWVTFTAIVARNASNGKGAPTGSVQFILDGAYVEEPVKLDSKGRATWETSRLKVGSHRVAARYIPTKGSMFLASTSLDKFLTVRRCTCVPIAGDK